MKAVIIREHGGVENLKINEMPDPKPRENEVIVRLHSAALNHLDIWIRKGSPGRKIGLPQILGSDGAGIVIEKGTNTPGINIGDEVIINPGLNCGFCEHCCQGKQSECASFGIIGMSRPGTYAEKIAVPFKNVSPKPSHLDFNQAAALTLTFLTAWHMLITRAKLKPGQTVLIHGIGGGVATACLQLAKLMSAVTIVTSSSNEKLEKAKKAEADYGVNYRTVPNISKAILELTAGKGVDIIADTVGAATWPVNFEVVKRGGTIVLCGITTGADSQTNLQALYWNQLNILGSTLGSYEDLRLLLNAVSAAKLVPIIDSIEPLQNVSKAMQRMENSQQFGKIVLSIYST